MSFLVGPLSGALVAGGVYYGFSNLIHSSTAQHRSDLHVLSERLNQELPLVLAPPPASTRIVHRPFASLLQDRWNQQVESLFRGVARLDERAVDTGKRLLYGREQS